MKQYILAFIFILMGGSVCLAKQHTTNMFVDIPQTFLLDDNNEREIDTLATTRAEWRPLLLEKAKERWFFQRLIYVEGEDVLLVVDRPIPRQKNRQIPASRTVNCKYCIPELHDPNRQEYIKDAYLESGPCIIHVVNNEIVERICH